MYTIISLTYRLWLMKTPNKEYKENFEKLVRYCGDYAGLIPVSFVLGFYVAQIVTRWWNQFLTIPWTDGLASMVACSIHGNDDRSRIMRRTIVRYVNCTFVLTLVNISPQVKARFPTMGHIVEAGLLLPHERMIFENLNANTDYPKYWIPIIWALNIVSRARQENRISHDVIFVNICNLILRFRNGCGDLLGYDWVCIPLVYTQVVTLAVHLYFAAALFGKQFIEDEHEIDLYVPIFLFLEFFFYMGWLKVAETMVNPFGEDDDDFEVNWLIDRNFSVSHLMVEMGQDFPQLTRDMYWDLGVPDGLPYTKAAEKFRTGTHLGSAHYEDVEVGDYLEPPTENLKDKEGGPSLFSSSRAAGARRSRSRVGTILSRSEGISELLRRDIGINLDPDTVQENIDQDRKPLAHLMEPLDIDESYLLPLHSSSSTQSNVDKKSILKPGSASNGDSSPNSGTVLRTVTILNSSAVPNVSIAPNNGASTSSGTASNTNAPKTAIVPNIAPVPNNGAAQSSGNAPNTPKTGPLPYSSTAPNIATVPNSGATTKVGTVPNSSIAPNSGAAPNIRSSPNVSSTPNAGSIKEKPKIDKLLSSPGANSDQVLNAAIQRERERQRAEDQAKKYNMKKP